MKLKPKYLSRLTRKQWLALHRTCFTERAKKVTSIEFWDNGKGADVTFLEEWDDGSEEALLLDTDYRYMDFDPPIADDVWDGVDRFERGKRFFAFMIETFGEEYIIDYIQYRTGVNVSICKDVLNNVKVHSR